jgi:hypothetical protein
MKPFALASGQTRYKYKTAAVTHERALFRWAMAVPQQTTAVINL